MGAIQTRLSSFFRAIILMAESKREKGKAAEDKALTYLTQQGLKLVARNFNSYVGEIDLIMRDKDYLVFIEVRQRSSNRFGDGIESITYTKRQKIIKTSEYYLIKNKVLDKFPLRFDMLSLDGKSQKITWIKDAFGADY